MYVVNDRDVKATDNLFTKLKNRHSIDAILSEQQGPWYQQEDAGQDSEGIKGR